MKNRQYTLKEALPFNVRLNVYIEALIDYRANYIDTRFSGLETVTENIGLCLALPCILWNLGHYLDEVTYDDGRKEYRWDYKDVHKAFPELAEGHGVLFSKLGNVRSIKTNADRVKVLESIVASMVCGRTLCIQDPDTGKVLHYLRNKRRSDLFPAKPGQEYKSLGPRTFLNAVLAWKACEKYNKDYYANFEVGIMEY